jgi:hypothetical protein
MIELLLHNPFFNYAAVKITIGSTLWLQYLTGDGNYHPKGRHFSCQPIR